MERRGNAARPETDAAENETKGADFDPESTGLKKPGAERAAARDLPKRRRAAEKWIAAAIVLLFAATVVLGAVGVGGGAAAFPTDVTISEKPIRYSSALTDRFYRAFRLFFLKENVADPLVEWLIDDLYSALSEARIPSEKVAWFAERVETIRAEENPAYLWIAEKNDLYEKLKSEYESGLSDRPPTFRDVFSASELTSGVRGAFSFLLTSPLTYDEMGRLFYRSAIAAADGSAYAELLQTVGEEDISMLTIGTYTVYRAAETLESAGSVAAARAAGQSLVALGSSYLSLIEKIGIGGADRLFGLDYRIPPEAEDGLISKETAPFYNAQLDALDGFAGGTLLIAGEILRHFSETLSEELWFSAEAEREGKTVEAKIHKIAAAAEFSYAIRRGLDIAKRKSEKKFATDREAIALLSEGYVASFRMADIFDENTDRLNDSARYDRYRNEAAEKLTKTLAAADRVRMLGRENQYARLLAEETASPGATDALYADAELLFDFDPDAANSAVDLVAGLLFNALVRLAAAS